MSVCSRYNIVIDGIRVLLCNMCNELYKMSLMSGNSYRPNSKWMYKCHSTIILKKIVGHQGDKVWFIFLAFFT